MDVLQLQAIIEQFLNFVQAQGPAAMQNLVNFLVAVKAGTASLGAIATLVAQSPALMQIIDKLITLINSGASIPEIAATVAEFAASSGLSLEAVINLLYMLGGALLIF